MELNPVRSSLRGSNYSSGPIAVCSTRSLPREPVTRGRKIGREALLTVQSLKRAKGIRDDMEQVLKSQASRLIKSDLLEVLNELHRQNDCVLAYEVFKLIRKEMWYKPDSQLYSRMMNLMGMNARILDVEVLFRDLQREMLPDELVFGELVLAYLRCERTIDAMDTFEEMKQLGLKVEFKTYTTLAKWLEKKGLVDQARAVRDECEEMYPPRRDKIVEVDKKGIRKRKYRVAI